MCTGFEVALLAGTAMMAGGTVSQSRAQSSVLRQQAGQTRRIAAINEDDFRRRQALAMGTRRAALGGAGVDLQSGSPLLVSEDFAAEAELQARRIRAGGEVRATRAEQQAKLVSRAGLLDAGNLILRGGSLLLPQSAKSFS